jgi:glutaminase
MRIPPETIIEAQREAAKGSLPAYIPLLATANPANFAFCYQSVRGEECLAGEPSLRFPLMSVIKPFLLLYLLSRIGPDKVFRHLGQEPSHYPFNSLAQLEEDEGRPRNPMLNSGAIYLASLLEEDCDLSAWLNSLAGTRLELDLAMLASVRSLPNARNHDLAQLMAARDYIADPLRAIDAYNNICCLSGTVIDLARLGLTILQPPPAIERSHCQIVQDMMMTCGLYEASADFAKRIGFPSKSGVSGAILSLVPPEGAVACYSPPLNAEGNSQAGIFLLEKIAE